VRGDKNSWAAIRGADQRVPDLVAERVHDPAGHRHRGPRDDQRPGRGRGQLDQRERVTAGAGDEPVPLFLRHRHAAVSEQRRRRVGVQPGDRHVEDARRSVPEPAREPTWEPVVAR
jgi:hypothetical protein